MKKELPHIRILKPADSIGFTTPNSGGGGGTCPARDRKSHGEYIKKKLEEAWKENENELAVTHSGRKGVNIEFKSSSDLDIEKLESLPQGIRLCNVREEEGSDTKYITVYIPNDKKKFFFDKIEQYLNENKGAYFKFPKFLEFEKIIEELKIGKSGIREEDGNLIVYVTKSKQEIFLEKTEPCLGDAVEYKIPIENEPKHKDLINRIKELRKALRVESFWTDSPELAPSTKQEWCEVWLRDDSEDVETRFNDLLKSQNIDSKSGCIKFPERLVKLIYASKDQLRKITENSDDIAEYRRAKTTAEFLLSQTPAEQSEWVDNLLGRLSVDNSSNVAVCILDTGVNNGHPLLKPVLSDEDCQAVNPDWGSHDHHSHGTLMAGLSAYGDLKSKLESNDHVNLGHILESIKILPPTGGNPVELWGDITKQAISRAEIQADDRKRITCMPVASDDTRDRGKPSSWSAAIDQITSGSDNEDKRLFILAAGNANPSKIIDYPQAQKDDSIHDPAQSWNAITVGAFTELTKITDSTYKDYSILAKEGQLSPFSTTSLTWENNQWPIKPEVVFEGGNAATDNSGLVEDKSNDLSLVSTNYKPQEESLYPFNMTSAAAAQAANFAAQIQAQYPDYWPETIRALMIHSAEWPQALKEQFGQLNDKGLIEKTGLTDVLKACGYGVPNLEKAIYCASNSLTLIAEAEIQPFEGAKTKDMHLYELPWPKEILEGLGESDVEMRITLSYFVEPGPGEIGWKDRYRYASHALRFDLNSPGEDKDIFVKRINKKSRDEDEGKPDAKSPTKYWVIGSDNRDKGSIHSDIWKGSAADLSDSNFIAISPVIGWWRERKHLGKSNKIGRYSLIVSITTPEQDVDIYTPVKIASEIKTAIEIKS